MEKYRKDVLTESIYIKYSELVKCVFKKLDDDYPKETAYMKGSGFGNAIGFAIKYTMASGRCHMYMASKDKDEATLNIEEKIFNRDLELMQAWFIDTYDKQYKK